MSVIFPANTTASSCPTSTLHLPKSNFKSIPVYVTFNHRRSSLHLPRLHAAVSPQPPNTEPDPPPQDDSKGVLSTLSKFQDRVQIFFAVLFWMSLFFWSSAWDGKNGGSGRLNKGSRFRR